MVVVGEALGVIVVSVGIGIVSVVSVVAAVVKLFLN